MSRLRPGYEQPGIRLGSFLVQPSFNERVGYDSNITGVDRGPSSGFAQTSAAIDATSRWTRNRLGAAFSIDNTSYFSEPGNSYTNYSASVGGGLTVGRHDVNLGYSHLRLHETGTDIGAVATSRPLPYDVDAIRGDYTIESGRFSFIPNIDVRLYQFGTAVIQGQETSQRFRDRLVTTGGVTTRYALTDQRNLVFVLQGSDSHFIRPTSGQPSNDSQTVLFLAGIDYQASGPWRYRLLGGGEVREFKSAQFGTRAGPVIEASVIWTPTGLTTVTGTIRRAIEDPQAEQTAGYTYTNIRAVVDHELRRNVLLQGRAAFQAAEYLQGGGNSQSYSVGGGATWLLNRRLRLGADYDFVRQNGSGGTSTATVTPTSSLNTILSGSYTRHLISLNLRVGL